jgi:hypothetical protein
MLTSTLNWAEANKRVQDKTVYVSRVYGLHSWKIEAEKGFRRTLFEPELVGPNVEINFVNSSMGSNTMINIELEFAEREIV